MGVLLRYIVAQGNVPTTDTDRIEVRCRVMSTLAVFARNMSTPQMVHCFAPFVDAFLQRFVSASEQHERAIALEVLGRMVVDGNVREQLFSFVRGGWVS